MKNKLGNIIAPEKYKGVTLSTLLKSVGGLSSGVKITASDGYAASFTHAQAASGSFTVYDPTTGDELTGYSGDLRLIIAYSKNGAALSSDEGPLRVAIISSSSDQVTTSSYWCKYVVKVAE